MGLVVGLAIALLFEIVIFGTAGGKLWEMYGGKFWRGFVFGSILGPGWLLLAWLLKSRKEDRHAN